LTLTSIINAQPVQSESTLIDRYAVQVLATKSISHANRKAAKLRAKGYEVYVEPVQNPARLIGRYYRVRTGCFDSISEAQDFVAKELAPKGFDYWIDTKSSQNLGLCGPGLPPVIIEAAAEAPKPEPVIQVAVPEPESQLVVEEPVEPEPEPEPEPAAPVKHPRRNHQIGLRGAANLSSAKDMSVRVEHFDFVNMQMRHTDYGSKYGYVGRDIGCEIQIPVFIGLTRMLALYTAPGFACRVPFSSMDDIASINELALTFPLKFDLKLADTPLHLSFGVQADVPFNAKTKREDGGKFDFDERSSIDFGLAAGMSLYITKNIFIDGRGVYGLTNFADEDKGSLYQFSIGAGWLFGR